LTRLDRDVLRSIAASENAIEIGISDLALLQLHDDLPTRTVFDSIDTLIDRGFVRAPGYSDRSREYTGFFCLTEKGEAIVKELERAGK
jgi:hypothetical protein